MAIAVNRRLLPAIAALLGGVAIVQAARAVDVYKDSAGVVYISGLEPKKVIKVQYENLPVTKQLGTDTCGVLTFTTKQVYANDYKVIDATGTESTFSGNGSKPEVAYRCKDGQAPNTEGWQSLGNGLKLATKPNSLRSVFYIAGLSPYKQMKLVGLDAYQERIIAANTCGIIKLISSEKYPLQRFYFYQSGNDTQGPFDASSLGVSSTPELCRNGVFYKPCLAGACDAAGPGYAGQPYTGGSGSPNNGSNNGSGGSNNGSGGTIGGGGS